MARVLISGGGIAALETALALDRLARTRVAVELISPRRDFVFRPRPSWAPVESGGAARFDLESVAAEIGTGYRSDVLAEVRVAEQEVVTKSGAVLPYDVLVIAHGATPERAVSGALTFWSREDEDTVRPVIASMEEGELDRIGLAVPAGMRWSLPLYELALMIADGVGPPGPSQSRLVIATHEDHPLELFGPEAGRALGRALEDRGVGIHTRSEPVAFTEGALELHTGHGVEADHVLALPRLVGREITGLPTDQLGFLPTGADSRVLGVDAIYAAGDATALPVKQGLFAGPQADAAAESIAASLGADLEPTPFRPVLRGTLVTADAPHSRLWWPQTGFAGRFLTAHLAGRSRAAVQAQPPVVEGVPVEVELAA